MWAFTFWILIVVLIFIGILRSGKKSLEVGGFVILSFKVMASVVVSWYYSSHAGGGGDILKFFNDASIILADDEFQIFQFYIHSAQDSVQFDTARTTLFIKFLLPIVWISANNFWLTTIMTGLLSFAIPYFIYIRYQDELQQYTPQLILVFFVLPSSLIWTSGIFKENISMLLLLLFMLPFLEYMKKKTVYKMKIYFWLTSIISFYFFIQLRYFIAILVIPIVGIIILSQLERSMKFKIGFSLFVIASFVLFLFIHPVLNPSSLPQYLFDAHFGILNSVSGGLPMYYSIENRDWLDIVTNLPHAIENVFLRPFPWEWKKIEYVLYAVENYMMLAIIIVSLLTVRAFNVWYLFILIILLLGISMISIATPNFGSLFRYRSLLFPFIAFLFAMHIPILKWINK